MNCVRSVWHSIFFLVLISCFIFPIVYAEQITEIHGLATTPCQVNETFNQSESTTITCSNISAIQQSVTGTLLPVESSMPADVTATPVSFGNLTLTPVPTDPAPEPTVVDTIPPVITTVSRELISTSAGSAPGREYVADQVIVRYNNNRFQNANVMSTSTASSNAKIGARVQKDFSDDGLSGMQLVTLPPNLSVEDAIAEYQKNPDVLYAEPNYIYYTAVTPNDPFYGNQWALYNITHPGVDIAAPDAWGISTGSDSVVVAVIDTGVDYNHPDLAANIWNNIDEIPSNGIDDDRNGYLDDIRGWNFYGNTSNPMDGNTYNNTYHGTHCSGILGADGNNGIGVSGVNWEVKIMPLRVANESGSLTEADAIKAINYASANGASVISLSWGGDSASQALKDAIDNSPAIVVCAAGNDRLDNDMFPFYPASFNSTNIISVGASDGTDARAWFSNYGMISVDLVAPGVSIFSTNISSANTTVNYHYQYMRGTSMATPFVAGVAALVKSVNPRLTNKQIRNVILNNVDVLPSLSETVNTSGRLNAYKAVLAAERMTQPTTIGLYQKSTGLYYLKYTNSDGFADNTFQFGNPSDNNIVPLKGDWNGDAMDTVGLYQKSTGLFYLRNSNTGGTADNMFQYGNPSDDDLIPLEEDWIGSGIDTAGLYQKSTGLVYLRYSNTGGTADNTFQFGNPSINNDLVPLMGDWTGSGIASVGLYQKSTGLFYLTNSNRGGIADNTFQYGNPSSTNDLVPLVGDWTGSGIDTIGLYQKSTGLYYLRNSNSAGTADSTFQYGDPSSSDDLVPLFGHWV